VGLRDGTSGDVSRDSVKDRAGYPSRYSDQLDQESIRDKTYVVDSTLRLEHIDRFAVFHVGVPRYGCLRLMSQSLLAIYGMTRDLLGQRHHH
jgi:hypothetical protein